MPEVKEVGQEEASRKSKRKEKYDVLKFVDY